MITQHTIVSRDLQPGDAVSTDVLELLDSGCDVPSNWTGTDVSLTGIDDDNYGDSFLTHWSDGSSFRVHPGLAVTVTRGQRNT